MIDTAFLDQLKELEFLVKRKVSTLYSGGRKSVKPGKGIEVIDYREYFPGDDFRLIDWRVYGRTEKLYIKRFEEEKNLVVHVMVDSSASMDFNTRGLMTKFDYGGSIAVGLGYLAVNNQEKFALALYGNDLREFTQPKRSRSHVLSSIHLLNSAKLNGETDLGRCASQYINMIKSKSYVVVVSDFIEPLDSLREGIYRMAKHSKELTLIQVLDPGEIDLPWLDDVKFHDMETDDVKRSYLSPSFKKDYRRQLDDHIYGVREVCEDLGADFFSLRTDTMLLDAFVNLIGGRLRGIKHARSH